MAEPIVIKIGFDTGDATRAAQKLAREVRSALDGVADESATAGRNAGSAFADGLTSSLRSVQQTLSSVGKQLTVSATLPLAGLGAAAIKAAFDVDKSRQTFVALTGSVDSANKKLAELRKLAAESPGVTSKLATTLFAQFKALGTIADSSINNIIKSIGRLNAVFSIPDVDQFARNLQQIFTQGFERTDIKEALGQVPIFEQILERAFGTKDPKKLRQLKESGKLTISAYMDALSSAVDTDPRFAKVQDSIASRFAKTKDAVLVALAPLGESILRTLQPVIERVVPQLIKLLDTFAALPPAVQENIVIFGLLVAALGPVLTGFATIASSITGVIGLLTGPAGLGIALSSLAPPFVLVAGFLAAGAIAWYEYQGAVKSATDQIDIAVRKQQESQGIFTNLQGQTTSRTGNIIPTGARNLFNQLPVGGLVSGQQALIGGPTSGVFNPMTGRFEGAPPPVVPSAATRPVSAGGGGGGGVDEALRASRRISELQIQVEQERSRALNRIWKEESDQRLNALSRQFDEGLIGVRQYYDEKLSLESLALQREFDVLIKESERLEKEREKARGAGKLEIELKLIDLYAEQTLNIKNLTQALEENFAAYTKRNALPQLDLDKTPQEQIQEVIDPRIQAARDRINADRENAIQQEVQLLNVRRQQAEIENLVNQGALSQADARAQINELLRQERDIRIAMLEAERAMEDITPQRRAEIELEIASIRNLGVELTAAQRFMRGFNSEVESTGDAFERLGQNLSRSFASVKGLLDNLKQSFVGFFRDLLGLGLQRIFGQLFGGLTAAIGGARPGAGGVSGGGVGGSIAGAATGILGGISGGGAGGLGALFGGGGGGGFLTPGFGGGFPAIGGGFAAAASGVALPIVNTAAIGAAGAAGIFGRTAGAGGAGALAGLSGLFRGFGFGQRAGSGGALAGIAPLLGAQLGAGLGGRSGLGQILGGIGGAALGIGITAAPAALAAGGALGGLGFLAPLFSNPITAVVGGALLVGSLLLGRSQQRKSDEEQSGIWLQDAINQIGQLRDQAKAGGLTVEQARQVFETQILATFVSQINTLKTKSVRESRLTNQVRDLRNLFETTVIAGAKPGAKIGALDDKLIPEFATGGVVPGIDRGYDSVMAMVRPGEMVLTRNQQSAIQSIAGSNVFQAVGVPDAPGMSAGMPAFALGGVMPAFTPQRAAHVQPEPIELVVNLVVGKEDSSRIVASAQSTSVGQRAVIATMRRARINREF